MRMRISKSMDFLHIFFEVSPWRKGDGYVSTFFEFALRSATYSTEYGEYSRPEIIIDFILMWIDVRLTISSYSPFLSEMKERFFVTWQENLTAWKLHLGIKKSRYFNPNFGDFLKSQNQ